MSRRPAIITQADVARVLRAAKQAGAGVVQIRPDGTILIDLQATTILIDLPVLPQKEVAPKKEFVL
jgi:hypothetical protein